MSNILMCGNEPLGLLQGNASDISFDNSGGGLLSDNVQDAIEEVNSKIPDISTKVSKSGDTMSGNLTIDTGNTSTVEMARIILGNNKETSAAGKSYGSVMIYGAGGYFNNLVSNDNLTGNRTVQLPNKNGTVALTSDLGVCDELMAQTNIPSGSATSYDCDWSSYYFLSIEAIQYGNVTAQILISTSYFNTTNSGNRPVITNPLNNMAHSIYKNGNSAVYITASSTVSTMGIRIYGIMKK